MDLGVWWGSEYLSASIILEEMLLMLLKNLHSILRNASIFNFSWKVSYFTVIIVLLAKKY